MNVLLLYLLLVKATLTSFSGLASVPVVRQDLVVRYKVLTDRELNAAIAAGRAGPGPLGLYVVSVGCFVAGWPGACAGWLAMVTPAFLIIPILKYLGRRAEKPAVQRSVRAVLLAAAGLIIASTIPLARDAVTGAATLGIAGSSFLVLVATGIDTFWIILGAALAGLLARLCG